MMDSANLQKTDEDVRNDVIRKAKEHDLPIEPKQVTVQRINSPGLSAVYVAADYRSRSACRVIPSTCTLTQPAEIKGSSPSNRHAL